MLQKKGKSTLTIFLTYSAMLHAFLFAFGSMSVMWPKKEGQLLVDIEIAGEGELREAERRYMSEPTTLQEENKEIPSAIEKKSVSEEKPIPEEKPEIVQPVPEPVKEEPAEEKIEEPDPVTEERNIPEEKIIQEDKNEEPESKNEEPAPKNEEPIAKDEEAVPNDEKLTPKDEEKKKPPKKEKKPKVKKKKRDRKIFMDAIKTAEKKSKRKKLQEIAIKSSKEQKNNNIDSDFDKMLTRNSEDLKRNIGQSSGKGKKGNGSGSFGSGNGLSEGDYEMISSQIYPHWSVPSGVRDAENIIIEVHVEIKDSGEVIPSSIKIIDEKRYMTDYIFRAAADSARRAILEASPLDIPKEKVELFREFTLRFNLKEALGG